MGITSASGMDNIEHTKVKDTYPTSLQRYEADINSPGFSRYYKISSDSQTITNVVVKNNNYSLKVGSRTITISKAPTFSYNHYDAQSGKRIKQGTQYKVPATYSKMAVIGVTPPSNTLTAGIFQSSTNLTDATQTVHYFYDKQTGAPRYQPLVIWSEPATQSVNPKSALLVEANNSTYYMYLQLGQSSGPQQVAVYEANNANNRFINVATIPYRPYRMKPFRNDGCVILYDNSSSPNKDELGYKIYDVGSKKIVQEVVVNGYTELLEVIESENNLGTIAVTDNHYASSTLVTWPTSDSFVKLYDIESATRVATFEGPAAKICALGATKDVVAAVSYDQSLYVWDRKSGKQIEKISIPAAAFYNSFPIDGIGLSIRGDLQIIDTKEIAFLLNTMYYYRYKIGQKQLEK
jgi:hypothetical protein